MTIELYTFPTPNGHKVSIMLEEAGLEYDVRIVDIERGDQHHPAFVELNPNGKIPVVIDRGPGRTIFEAGAILFYLADKTGVFRPTDEDARLYTLQWLLFQTGHVGPMLGQLWHFQVFADEKLPYAINRYRKEAWRLYGVLEHRLRESSYLVDDYGIADIATWPWIDAAATNLELSLDGYPNLARWHRDIKARPAVQRGVAVPQHV